MEVATVAGQLAPAFVSLLPYLMGASQRAAQAAADRVGRHAGERAVAGLAQLWDRFWPKLRDRPSGAAARRLAQQPDRRDQSELRSALEAILVEEPDLRAAARDLLRRYPRIGGDISGVKDSIVVQGDHNVIQHGEDNVALHAGGDITVGGG